MSYFSDSRPSTAASSRPSASSISASSALLSPAESAAETPPRPPAPPATAPRSPIAWLPQPGREGSVASLIVIGGGLVLFLWWHDSSVGSIGSLGERLTAIGRITGLLGTYLLLV